MITTELIDIADAFKKSPNDETLRAMFHDLLIDAGYARTAQLHFENDPCDGTCVIVDWIIAKGISGK